MSALSKQKMNLIEIEDKTIISSEELKTRVKESSKNAYTKHYLVKEDESEIAFLSLDVMYKEKLMFLYEIFVMIQKRRKGYGSIILDMVCVLTKNLSFNKVCVNPLPFDRTLKMDDLYNFYLSKGFKRNHENSELVKLVGN